MTHHVYYDFSYLRVTDLVPGDTFAFANASFDVGPLVLTIKPEHYVIVREKQIVMVVSRRASIEWPYCNLFVFLLPGPILSSETLLAVRGTR